METISMSAKERRRLEVFSRVKAWEFSLARAADLLGISGRQAKRIWARYRDDGDAAIEIGVLMLLMFCDSWMNPPPEAIDWYGPNCLAPDERDLRVTLC